MTTTPPIPVPPGSSGQHLRVEVLHLWGRADGARIHPDFAWLGGI